MVVPPPCHAGTRGDVVLLNALSLHCPPPSFTHGCMHSSGWGGGSQVTESPSLWGSPIALVVAQGYTEHCHPCVPRHGGPTPSPQALLGEEGKGFGTH